MDYIIKENFLNRYLMAWDKIWQHKQYQRVGQEKLATFFAPQWAKVGGCITAGLDTVNLSGLNSATTQPCLVSTPAVLLAQQHVHSALRPLCGLPAVTKERGGQTLLRLI